MISFACFASEVMNLWRYYNVILAIAACLATGCGAATAQVDGKVDAAPAAAAATPQPAPAALTGSIQTDTTALDALREIRELCKHVKRVGTDFLYETQRPYLVATGGPTVFGTTVIPARPDPGGVVNLGTFMQPRKKWLDYFYSELLPLLPRLQAEAANLAAPSLRSDMQELISDLNNEVNNLEQAAAKLKQDIDKQPPFDNFTIGGHATELNTIAKRIEKDQELLERAFKRDQKQMQKLSKSRTSK
jgi:hypothetical protein